MDAENYQEVCEALEEAQKADHDQREQSREAHLFCNQRNGMWEQYWWNNAKDKPRYTFDLTNPVVDLIMGDIEEKDFQIKVMPGSGEADDDSAQVYDGMVRSIEDFSRARRIYHSASRASVTGGLGGWRIVQQYAEGDSFDQDIVIERVGNWTDRVWFGPHEEPDASDANYCFILTAMDKKVYEANFEDRAGMSVEVDRSGQGYYHKPDSVVVGEFIYLKAEKRTLLQMSDGSVHAKADVESVLEEMAMAGITVVEERERRVKCAYIRRFDGEGWIDDEARKTVFQNWLPAVPIYGNFELFEDKITYSGAVEKMMDAQRVFNYTLSRQIEEGALAPRAKYWMTREQAEGEEDTLATLNTNADPVQFYTPDERVPGAPQQNGGAQVNAGLQIISDSMQQIVSQSAGMFAANMGDNPNVQSGKAIEALQDRGDMGNNKYVSALELAIEHTARIIVDAIPRVYQKNRQVRLLREDGSFEMESLGKTVTDQETGQIVNVYDLSKGTYRVNCSSGPSFKSRQSETVDAITSIAGVNPEILQLGSDVLLNNIPSPGMSDIAERQRQMLFNNGVIPESQMTDEEKQMVAQAQEQEPQPDPAMVMAMAEQTKAEADLQSEQNKANEIQMNAAGKQQELAIKSFEAETGRINAMIDRAKAQAEVGVKNSQAAKYLEEAEAQSIENDAVVTGMADILERAGNVEVPSSEEASS